LCLALITEAVYLASDDERPARSMVKKMVHRSNMDHQRYTAAPPRVEGFWSIRLQR
jgi:hypothetical protein